MDAYTEYIDVRVSEVLENCAALIVDEFGIWPYDRESATAFFSLVSARYERGSIILTSNKGFADWGELLGDTVIATAILDRLLKPQSRAQHPQRLCTKSPVCTKIDISPGDLHKSYLLVIRFRSDSISMISGEQHGLCHLNADLPAVVLYAHSVSLLVQCRVSL